MPSLHRDVCRERTSSRNARFKAGRAARCRRLDQRPVRRPFAGLSASKFHHRLVPTNFSDVCRAAIARSSYAWIEAGTTSMAVSVNSCGRPGGHVAWLDRTALVSISLRRNQPDQRIQMPAYCGTRQSEETASELAVVGPGFEEDSARGAGAPVRHGLASDFTTPLCPISREATPCPARERRHVAMNQAVPETASH